MWGCDCYSTFRRRVSALPFALRLALSPAWPRGMPPGRSADVTAMLCTSSPPSLPFTLPLSVEPTCCSGKAHARQGAQIPPSRPRLRASAFPSPLTVCVQQLRPGELMLDVLGWGVEIKQTMTFPFPARFSQVKTHLKTTSVISDPAPHPTPSSTFKRPVSRFSLLIS